MKATGSGSILALMVCLSACDAAPRFGEARLSAGNPRATLSGETFGDAAALELAPGCPGYLDVDTPNHVLRIEDDVPFTVEVSSDRGPLALAIAKDEEVRCDSDEGSGHLPRIRFAGAGRYAVYVASLRGPAALPYELSVSLDGAALAAAEPIAAREVIITFTSEPSGATILAEDGRELGTTPALISLPRATDATPRRFTLRKRRYLPQTVEGRLDGPALVLHAALPRGVPERIVRNVSEPRPIEDFRSVAHAIDVTQPCPIARVDVEVAITHTYVGDLRIVLEPPNGSTIQLQRHEFAARRNLTRRWSSEPQANARGAAPLAPLVGTMATGTWVLTVFDDAGGDRGTFDRFTLELACRDDEGDDDDPAPVGTSTGSTALLGRADIVRALSAVRPAVERCARGISAEMRVELTLTGRPARIDSLDVRGREDRRACVEAAVRRARFDGDARDGVRASHVFYLSAR